MLVSFVLSMPNIGSWNGKWTGEDNLYVIVRSFVGKERSLIADRVIEKGYYHYNFGDGWSAGVTIKKVDSKISAKLKRKSKGFCGYDWMVDSIIKYDEILNSLQIKEIEDGVCR